MVLLQVVFNFNSIKVRLKHGSTTKTFSPQALFQFHKGTIKTVLKPVRRPFVRQFQFHKGTIKTYTDNLLAVGSEISIP